MFDKGYYRGFYLEIEEDRDDDVIKRFHYAVSTKTGKWYPIDHSPYSNPDDAKFKKIVDELAFEDFVRTEPNKAVDTDQP